MIKDIGRLDAAETKKIEDFLAEIFSILDDGEVVKAIKMLEELCKTNNYFLREMVGKYLTKYHDQDKMSEIASDMLNSKVYGIRAAAVFYYFNKYLEDPPKLVSLLEENYDSVPWEVESIIYELWKNKPRTVKEMSLKWLDSDDEKKRMIAFHGLELIAETDTIFVLDFVTKAVDDPSMEIQKKITHIVMQMVKSKPAETYAYIREWIMTASDKRLRIIIQTLKKVISLYTQKNQKDKTPEFMMLTKHIINEWKSDQNKKVASIGNKLLQAYRKECNSR